MYGSAQLVSLAQLIFYFRQWGSSRRLSARDVEILDGPMVTFFWTSKTVTFFVIIGTKSAKNTGLGLSYRSLP